jgi:hypothetical protein
MESEFMAFMHDIGVGEEGRICARAEIWAKEHGNGGGSARIG